MPRVALIKGKRRRDNIRKSLDLVSDEIRKDLGSRQVVIKPNFVSTHIQLAASHRDQMRGILDFFREFYTGRIIVAEAACGDTAEAYGNFGYLGLREEYGVELVDLNNGPSETVSIEDSAGRPLEVRVAGLLMDEDSYLVSAARLKTHDTVVVTLSVKNMAMGGVLLADKKKVHQGIRRTNLNIAKLAGLVWPDLAVIDGLVGMEGNGPSHGDPVYLGVALSSTDALAADRVACEVMGVDFFKVGYLSHCAWAGRGESDIRRIEVWGSPLGDCVRPFRLHSTVRQQYKWREG